MKITLKQLMGKIDGSRGFDDVRSAMLKGGKDIEKKSKALTDIKNNTGNDTTIALKRGSDMVNKVVSKAINIA